MGDGEGASGTEVPAAYMEKSDGLGADIEVELSDDHIDCYGFAGGAAPFLNYRTFGALAVVVHAKEVYTQEGGIPFQVWSRLWSRSR